MLSAITLYITLVPFQNIYNRPSKNWLKQNKDIKTKIYPVKKKEKHVKLGVLNCSCFCIHIPSLFSYTPECHLNSMFYSALTSITKSQKTALHWVLFKALGIHFIQKGKEKPELNTVRNNLAAAANV